MEVEPDSSGRAREQPVAIDHESFYEGRIFGELESRAAVHMEVRAVCVMLDVPRESLRAVRGGREGTVVKVVRGVSEGRRKGGLAYEGREGKRHVRGTVEGCKRAVRSRTCAVCNSEITSALLIAGWRTYCQNRDAVRHVPHRAVLEAPGH